MSKYLELVEISEGVVVLRRSDLKDSPLVKIEFSSEVKSLLNGMEFDVAKEMIKNTKYNDSDTEDIPINVDYRRMTAVLTKALQEAIVRIETLESEVAALKSS